MTISTTSTQHLAFAPSHHTNESSAPTDLLPSPHSMGGDADPGAELAMLLFRAEKDRRNDIKFQIRSNAETEQREQEQQLNDLESKANAALASGIAGALGSGASSLLSFMEVKPTKVDTAGNKALIASLRASNSACDAATKTQTAVFTHISDVFNTHATRHAQAASRAQETRQTLQADLSEAKETMNKALQFMSEFRKQHAEISLSIWRR